MMEIRSVRRSSNAITSFLLERVGSTYSISHISTFFYRLSLDHISDPLTMSEVPAPRTSINF